MTLVLGVVTLTLGEFHARFEQRQLLVSEIGAAVENQAELKMARNGWMEAIARMDEKAGRPDLASKLLERLKIDSTDEKKNIGNLISAQRELLSPWAWLKYDSFSLQHLRTYLSNSQAAIKLLVTTFRNGREEFERILKDMKEPEKSNPTDNPPKSMQPGTPEQHPKLDLRS